MKDIKFRRTFVSPQQNTSDWSQNLSVAYASRDSFSVVGFKKVEPFANLFSKQNSYEIRVEYPKVNVYATDSSETISSTSYFADCTPMQISWSPIGSNGTCLLAVLLSDGNGYIYEEIKGPENGSGSVVKTHCLIQPLIESRLDKESVFVTQQTANSIKITSLAWIPKLSSKNECLYVVSTISQTLSLVKVEEKLLTVVSEITIPSIESSSALESVFPLQILWSASGKYVICRLSDNSVATVTVEEGAFVQDSFQVIVHPGAIHVREIRLVERPDGELYVFYAKSKSFGLVSIKGDQHFVKTFEFFAERHYILQSYDTHIKVISAENTITFNQDSWLAKTTVNLSSGALQTISGKSACKNLFNFTEKYFSGVKSPEKMILRLYSIKQGHLPNSSIIVLFELDQIDRFAKGSLTDAFVSMTLLAVNSNEKEVLEISDFLLDTKNWLQKTCSTSQFVFEKTLVCRQELTPKDRKLVSNETLKQICDAKKDEFSHKLIQLIERLVSEASGSTLTQLLRQLRKDATFRCLQLILALSSKPKPLTQTSSMMGDVYGYLETMQHNYEKNLTAFEYLSNYYTTKILLAICSVVLGYVKQSGMENDNVVDTAMLQGMAHLVESNEDECLREIVDIAKAILDKYGRIMMLPITGSDETLSFELSSQSSLPHEIVASDGNSWVRCQCTLLPILSIGAVRCSYCQSFSIGVEAVEGSSLAKEVLNGFGTCTKCGGS